MKSSDSEILYCDNHLLIALKACGLLTQPNDSDDDSLEARAKAWVKKEFKKPGNVFLHAVHRLDRPVSGLLLFARTSKALSRLNEQSRNQEIQRIYVAEVEGILGEKKGKLDHYLIHGDHHAIVAKPTNKEAKHARLTYEVLSYKAHTTIVKIELETGRYHQIRAQFSAAGHPIVGDLRYGAKSGDGESIRLHFTEIGFEHPVTKEVLRFTTPAPFSLL
jgi:23S rRNA pseudouridine1911/1915/1917 synthase